MAETVTIIETPTAPHSYSTDLANTTHTKQIPLTTTDFTNPSIHVHTHARTHARTHTLTDKHTHTETLPLIYKKNH